MILVITEKNDAAQKIANILGENKEKKDSVYKTTIFRFKWNSNDCVSIGLRGHIMQIDFPNKLEYSKSKGWYGICGDDSQVSASLPNKLKKPPFDKAKRPFTKKGVNIKTWNIKSLEYLTYAPTVLVPKEKEIIRSLKNLAKKSDEIIIATDFDREGELIGSDAMNICMKQNPDAKYFRSRYSSFTKTEITESFANLTNLDQNLADAGESRREIDLIWGANITRFLTVVKYSVNGGVQSSGRVQGPTLGLICEKELERKAFVPEKYWTIRGFFDGASRQGAGLAGLSDLGFFQLNFVGEDQSALKPYTGLGLPVMKLGDKQPEGVNEKMLNRADKFVAEHEISKFKTEQEAISALASIKEDKTARVVNIEKKSRKQHPPTPFNTTSLQAAAASEGFAPARTMRLAESLYMAGFISYPRVDNTVYPKSLNLTELVKMLGSNPAYASYCQKLLAQGQLVATRGKKETTDHPPIYPTAVANCDMLKADEFKLYNLIARRFLATLSGPATIEGTKLYLKVTDQCFIAKGDVLIYPGYREIYAYGMPKQSQLPNLEIGQDIAFDGAYCAYKQTDPPPRYSQGRLIQEMEKLGLGTKATRHSIIERLYEVRYIVDNPMAPTARGMAIYDALNKFAPRIMHSEMTSELEKEMNDVCEGKTTKDKVVYRSRDDLDTELSNLVLHQEEVAEALAVADDEDSYVGTCLKCGGDLQFRRSKAKRSVFIGCKNWPNCDAIYAVPDGKLEVMDDICEVCGAPKIRAIAFRSRPIIKCIDPECSSNQEPDIYIAQCPVCQKNAKDGRLFAHRNPSNWKRSISCENVEECGTRYPLPKNGEILRTDEFCEDCGAPIVVVSTKRGPWRLCPNMSCSSKEKDKSQKK